MRFYSPNFLWLLLVIPAALGIMFLTARMRKGRAKKIGQPSTIMRLFGQVDRTAGMISFLLLLAGFAFVVAALARPQYPGGVEKVEARGGKIVIALDVSLSMLAPDFQPNRLEKAKREIIDLVEKLKAQTIGLVIFAGEAFVQCPPTVDYSAFRIFLDVADVGMISDTGTDLADAIKVSAKLLDDGTSVDKAVIILSDGESFEGDAEKAAKEAADLGIRIFTIGVGSATGRPIPEFAGGQSTLKKNIDGEVVITRLDDKTLTQVAESGNGKFYRATPGGSELDEIYADIKGLKGEEKETKFRTVYSEKYRWLLLPGLALLSLSAFIPTSRRNSDAD